MLSTKFRHIRQGLLSLRRPHQPENLIAAFPEMGRQVFAGKRNAAATESGFHDLGDLRRIDGLRPVGAECMECNRRVQGFLSSGSE
jgi:hypothetical protein